MTRRIRVESVITSEPLKSFNVLDTASNLDCTDWLIRIYQSSIACLAEEQASRREKSRNESLSTINLIIEGL